MNSYFVGIEDIFFYEKLTDKIHLFVSDIMSSVIILIKKFSPEYLRFT